MQFGEETLGIPALCLPKLFGVIKQVAYGVLNRLALEVSRAWPHQTPNPS
jgi:hypothetical protein